MNKEEGRKAAALLLFAALTATAPAFAQSRACRNADPDRGIAACTADIVSAESLPVVLRVYFMRAAAYEKKGMLAEARADLDKAVSLAPVFVTYFNRGAFCNDHGPISCALADFEAAIAAYEKTSDKAVENSYAQANYRRAEILRRLDRLGEAMPAYDKAVATRPDNVEFRFNRALASSRLQRYDAVIADLTRVIDISPRRGGYYVSALNNRGTAYMRQGKFAEAVADMDRALAVDRTSPLTLALRGLVFERAGQRDQAIADYRESLKFYVRMQEALDGLERLGAVP